MGVTNLDTVDAKDGFRVNGTEVIDNSGQFTGTLPAGTNTNSFMTQIGGFGASQQKFIFVAPSACTVTNVVLVSDTATTGSNGAAIWSFQVANLTQTEDLLSAAQHTDATGTGTEISADTAYDITPNQNATIAADDVLELQITKTGAPTDLSSAEVAVQVIYTVSE